MHKFFLEKSPGKSSPQPPQSICGTGVASGHHDLTIPADTGRSPDRLDQQVQPAEGRGISGPTSACRHRTIHISSASPADERQLHYSRRLVLGQTPPSRQIPIYGRNYPVATPFSAARPALPGCRECDPCRHGLLGTHAHARQLESLRNQLLWASTRILANL